MRLEDDLLDWRQVGPAGGDILSNYLSRCGAGSHPNPQGNDLNAAGRHGLMTAADTPASQQQSLNLLRHQATVGDVGAGIGEPGGEATVCAGKCADAATRQTATARIKLASRADISC